MTSGCIILEHGKGRSQLGRVTGKGWVALGLCASLHCTGDSNSYKSNLLHPPKSWENEKNLRQMKMLIIVTIYGSLMCTKSKAHLISPIKWLLLIVPTLQVRKRGLREAKGYN